MLKEIIFLVEEAPEGGFFARAVDHAIFTEAKTLEELKVCAREAVNCHFDAAEKPSLIHLHIVRDEVIPA